MSRNKETSRTRIAQGRAEYAYKRVDKAKSTLSDKATDYKSYIKKMPMYIKTNGLAATIAFAKSKSGSKAWVLVYEDIETWLDSGDSNVDIDFVKGRLAGALTNLDSTAYRLATIEVLALLTWLKRFADGLIEGEAKNAD